MVKATSESKKDHANELLHTPKDGFVQKKKSKKFKQTPTGKIALINGSKASNDSNDAKQQQLNKQKNSASKKSMEGNKEQRTQDSSKSEKKLQETPKKIKVEPKEDSCDNDDDINEGVVLDDHSFIQESSEAASEDDDNDSDEDESENEQNLPNILGTSLADDSDEDDDDYEGDEDNLIVNKGVKMFKGVKSKDTTDTSESEGNSNDDGEEDEEEENALDSDDDDEDESDSDEEGEESDDEEEGDESKLSWEAILSNSIVEDDEDDEDFSEPENIDEDDDDDISEEDEEEDESNSKANIKEKTKKQKASLDLSLEEMKEDKRTIFVGNLPKEVTKKQLQQHFKKFGNIDTVRLRGIIGKSMKTSKKVAAIKKDLHPKLKSVFAYIRYKSEESAKAALSMNGKVFDGNHLRVDLASKSDEKHDVKKGVFVGNLHFNIEENAVRKHFKGCGEIESIRIIKDNKTGIGKGFGYVNFKTEDAVSLALELNGTSLQNRELRVKPCYEHPKKEKKDKQQKKRSGSTSEDQKSSKKIKNNEEVAVPVHNKKNATKRPNEKGQKFDVKQSSPKQSKAFQGQTADEKKKKKSNKLEKKKKIMAEKLAAKPKKP
nr:RNA-binding protein 34-like [Megalopta genalis]